MKQRSYVWQRITAFILILIGLIEWLYPDAFPELSTYVVGAGVLIMLFGLGLYALFSPSKSNNDDINQEEKNPDD